MTSGKLKMILVNLYDIATANNTLKHLVIRRDYLPFLSIDFWL